MWKTGGRGKGESARLVLNNLVRTEHIWTAQQPGRERCAAYFVGLDKFSDFSMPHLQGVG